MRYSLVGILSADGFWTGAHRFAAQSGKEWVDMMDKSATGLYGSQWMVVDYNKFTPGKPIQDGTLMVPGARRCVELEGPYLNYKAVLLSSFSVQN